MTRRYWKAEEKLAIINEIREKGHVLETCRKLKKENERLRKIVADKELDVEMLQEALKNTKKFCKSINQ